MKDALGQVIGITVQEFHAVMMPGIGNAPYGGDDDLVVAVVVQISDRGGRPVPVVHGLRPTGGNRTIGFENVDLHGRATGRNDLQPGIIRQVSERDAGRRPDLATVVEGAKTVCIAVTVSNLCTVVVPGVDGVGGGNYLG